MRQTILACCLILVSAWGSSFSETTSAPLAPAGAVADLADLAACNLIPGATTMAGEMDPDTAAQLTRVAFASYRQLVAQIEAGDAEPLSSREANMIQGRLAALFHEFRPELEGSGWFSVEAALRELQTYAVRATRVPIDHPEPSATGVSLEGLLHGGTGIDIGARYSDGQSTRPRSATVDINSATSAGFGVQRPFINTGDSSFRRPLPLAEGVGSPAPSDVLRVEAPVAGGLSVFSEGTSALPLSIQAESGASALTRRYGLLGFIGSTGVELAYETRTPSSRLVGLLEARNPLVPPPDSESEALTLDVWVPVYSRLTVFGHSETEDVAWSDSRISRMGVGAHFRPSGSLSVIGGYGLERDYGFLDSVYSSLRADYSVNPDLSLSLVYSVGSHDSRYASEEALIGGALNFDF